MPKENCTVTVTDYALYPLPIVEFVENVKKPFVQKLFNFDWRALVKNFRYFDLASIRKDTVFHPASKIQKDTAKDTKPYTQRPLAIFSILEAVQPDSKKISII